MTAQILLDLVRTGGRTGRPGRAVLIRGRRRVGKSRLVEEFAQRAALPLMAGPRDRACCQANCWLYPAPVPPPATSRSSYPRTCSPHGSPP